MSENRVLVGMSGGVDSTVAAAMLKEQGNEVGGVTLKLTTNTESGCCSLADMEDARAAAWRLQIPFFVFDFTKDFEREVVQRFAEGYRDGYTPNPCLDCNQYIKFNLMLERALMAEYTHIATGHYARVEYSGKLGRWLLKKAADEGKDQSYVLYTLSQDELAHLMLPLGKLHKTQVRAKAAQLGLSNADKPDSQDICFIPDGDYARYISSEEGIEVAPGEFLDMEGNLLGTHKGHIAYTIGQRRGLGVSAPQRLYVVDKDAQKNTVTLGTESQLLTNSFLVHSCNWIKIPALENPTKTMVRTRYHQKEAVATLTPLHKGQVLVEFEQPQRRPAPGQAAVFYDEEDVLGGGRIV